VWPGSGAKGVRALAFACSLLHVAFSCIWPCFPVGCSQPQCSPVQMGALSLVRGWTGWQSLGSCSPTAWAPPWAPVLRPLSSESLVQCVAWGGSRSGLSARACVNVTSGRFAAAFPFWSGKCLFKLFVGGIYGLVSAPTRPFSSTLRRVEGGDACVQCTSPFLSTLRRAAMPVFSAQAPSCPRCSGRRAVMPVFDTKFPSFV
jgi:hypothetical protein